MDIRKTVSKVKHSEKLTITPWIATFLLTYNHYYSRALKKLIYILNDEKTILVTDGEVFMEALFTNKALENFFYKSKRFVQSNMEWCGNVFLIKEFHIECIYSEKQNDTRMILIIEDFIHHNKPLPGMILKVKKLSAHLGIKQLMDKLWISWSSKMSVESYSQISWVEGFNKELQEFDVEDFLIPNIISTKSQQACESQTAHPSKKSPSFEDNELYENLTKKINILSCDVHNKTASCDQQINGKHVGKNYFLRSKNTCRDHENCHKINEKDKKLNSKKLTPEKNKDVDVNLKLPKKLTSSSNEKVKTEEFDASSDGAILPSLSDQSFLLSSDSTLYLSSSNHDVSYFAEELKDNTINKCCQDYPQKITKSSPCNGSVKKPSNRVARREIMKMLNSISRKIHSLESNEIYSQNYPETIDLIPPSNYIHLSNNQGKKMLQITQQADSSPGNKKLKYSPDSKSISFNTSPCTNLLTSFNNVTDDSNNFKEAFSDFTEISFTSEQEGYSDCENKNDIFIRTLSNLSTAKTSSELCLDISNSVNSLPSHQVPFS